MFGRFLTVESDLKPFLEWNIDLPRYVSNCDYLFE